MNDAELDQVYSSLAQALSRLGEQRSARVLAYLCLALMSRQESAQEMLVLIEKAERDCAE